MAKELRIKNVSTGRTGEYVPEVYDSVVAAFYLVVILASGKLAASGAITFA